MLRALQIQNYAIIERLQLQFSSKLTVITGETGAGKSIVVEALSLVLGSRADTSVLFDKAKKCLVEAVFDDIPETVTELIRKNDLDEGEELVLRREISAAGKSRAFVNDTPVNLAQLKAIGDLLVDMHQQHESQELSTEAFQVALLDSLAGQEGRVQEWRRMFSSFQHLTNQRQHLLEKHQAEVQELDYYTFQWKELQNAALKPGEQELLEQEQQQLEHAEEIQRSLTLALMALQESDDAVMQRIRTILQWLQGIRKYMPAVVPLLERLESSRIELGDITDELASRQEQVAADPSRLTDVVQRLNELYRLQQKHHAPDEAALFHKVEGLQQKINSISIQTEELEELDQTLLLQKEKLVAEARVVSAARRGQVSLMTEQINAMLKEVGMPHARIKVAHQELSEEAMSANGLDHFRFLFASNRGSDFLDIGKVASGGELSRLMLCFKSLVAASTDLPTLIFDEIDTGISGETAMKVSRILSQLAAAHQVICITHLPQLAAKGNAHYFVYKENEKGRTHTRVRELKEEEKVLAVARMISGEKVTAAALESARELLN